MSAYCAGIDLGTTNTVLATWHAGEAGPRVVPIAQPWDDVTADGVQERPLLDSVVSVADGRVFVGGFARQLGLVGAAHSFSSIKRYMGRHWFRVYAGFGWTPERVSGCILRVVRDDLLRRFGHLPERIVVTIPASFGTEARRATLEAARLAGFERVSLFDEPTAALLAELQGHGELQVGEPPALHAVVDIGGGTLDVSLVRVGRVGGRTLFDVIGQSRYNELAGDDFDLNIAGLLLHRFEAAHSVGGLRDDERKLLFWALLDQARSVKHRLADVMATVHWTKWQDVRESVTISELLDVPVWRTEVTGSDLVEALREYFPDQRSAEARRSEFGFFKPIQECLDTAEIVEGRPILPEEIDAVWLAGGSASLPPVKMAVQRILSSRPRLVHEPMYAVALGAAWKSGLDAGYAASSFSVRERLFDGIYLKRSDDSFHRLIPARQEVPLARVETPDLLRMPAPDNRLELELYLGVPSSAGGSEPEYTPLARRRATFPRIVQAGEAISVAVELTADRELRLELFAGGQKAQVAVGTGAGWEDAVGGVRLPAVNVVEAG